MESINKFARRITPLLCIVLIYTLLPFSSVKSFCQKQYAEHQKIEQEDQAKIDQTVDQIFSGQKVIYLDNIRVMSMLHYGGVEMVAERWCERHQVTGQQKEEKIRQFLQAWLKATIQLDFPK